MVGSLRNTAPSSERRSGTRKSEAPVNAGPAGKLSCPRLANVVNRERLYAELDALAVRPLLWITGPPGSGKSTLAASWLAARSRIVTWLVLDAEDAEPSTFFHYLGLAVTNTVGMRRLELPRPLARDLQNPAQFLRRLLQVIAAKAPPGWTVVLDNYHELATTDWMDTAIANACLAIPGHAQIIATSRLPAPVSLARERVSQNLGELQSMSLRFTVEETRQLQSLSPRSFDPQALQRACDGWVAGIVLILDSNTDDAGSLHDSSSVFPANAAAGEKIFEYFASEVFARMGPSEQTMLLKIAWLPFADAALSKAVTGSAQAPEMLAGLFRRNLFLDRRGENSHATYVLHALFRDFLRQRSRASLQASAFDDLMQILPGLLEGSGQIEPALQHLLAQERWQAAWEMLCRSAPELLAQRRRQTLKSWINLLPTSWREHPKTQYWSGQCEIERDPARALVSFRAAYEGFSAFEKTEQPPLDGGVTLLQGSDASGPRASVAIWRLLAAAGAAECIAIQGFELGALDNWIAIFESLIPQYSEIEDVETELLALPGILAAFIARCPQHTLAGVFADRAEKLLDLDSAASQQILFSTVANALIDTGQHERLGRMISRLAPLRDASHIAPVTALRWQLAEIYFKTLVGRVEEAVADSHKAEALVQEYELNELLPTTQLAAAQACWVAHDTVGARRYIEQARVGLSSRSLYHRSVLEFLTGVTALQDGDTAASIERLTLAAAHARQAGSLGRERVANFILCLAQTNAGNLEAAESALAQANSDPSLAASRFHQWVIAIIEANLAECHGDSVRGAVALRRGFEIARQDGFGFAPGLFATGLIPRMCASAIDRDIEPVLVRQMIRRHRIAAPRGAGPKWPWPIRIETLGRFRLSRDDEPVPEARKIQRKPIELLQLTIAMGGNGVPTHRIVDRLWPDADGDSAKNSFDNALHRLRKLLGTQHAIRLEEGALTFDPDCVYIDALALDTRLAEIERALADQRDPSRRAAAVLPVDWHAALSKELLDACPGPFLPGDQAFPEFFLMRERIRDRLVRVISDCCCALERDGRSDLVVALYRRVIDQDPLAEEAYRHLMRCLDQQGRRAEALDVWRRCRDNLSIILGIQPSGQTLELANRILNP